jgi:hypothetical protein
MAVNFSALGVVYGDLFHTTLHATAACLVTRRDGGAQPPWMQQLGQLPRIDDTSDTVLPSLDTYELQQHQDSTAQQPYREMPPTGAAAGQLTPAGADAHQAAAEALHEWQQQQQRKQQQQPAHMCFKEQSRDVLVLLSDCDTTLDSLRPS